MKQHTHRTTPFKKREFPIVIICDGVQGPANIGSLFRVSDAFGVSELVFMAGDISMQSPRMRKTSRDTYKKVSWSESDNPAKLLEHYREAGYILVALEISSKSKELSGFNWDKDQKIALIVGNEQHGISQEVLSLADHVLHIELFGENSSINVSHAAAIALYELTRPVAK